MSYQEEFYDKWKQPVINAVRFKRLFPSVMLAQAAIESGYGKSTLTDKYNNLFGIKADNSWDGEKVLMSTREVFSGKTVYINDYFRVYKNKSKSIKDRVEFLERFDRYKPVFEAKTPQQQAQALQDAGYATDPNYAKVISKVISDYDLEKYDRLKEFQNYSILFAVAASITLLIIFLVKKGFFNKIFSSIKF